MILKFMEAHAGARTVWHPLLNLFGLGFTSMPLNTTTKAMSATLRFKGRDELVQLIGHRKSGLHVLENGTEDLDTTRMMIRNLFSATNKEGFTQRTHILQVHHICWLNGKKSWNSSQTLSFQTLDINQDPSSRGSEVGKYNMVVASLDVDAESTLKSVKQRRRDAVCYTLRVSCTTHRQLRYKN